MALLAAMTGWGQPDQSMARAFFFFISQAEKGLGLVLGSVGEYHIGLRRMERSITLEEGGNVCTCTC